MLISLEPLKKIHEYNIVRNVLFTRKNQNHVFFFN